MTSFIVASSDKKKRELYIAGFLFEQQVDAFDITSVGLEESKNLASIGIDEIKNLQKKIFLKPINSEKKVIVLDDAESLTIEAQNSLLKVLEEPPDKTIIILSTSTSEALLPTILSRCQIVELEKESVSLSDDEAKEMEKFVNNLYEMRVGDRLKMAEELAKDKEQTVSWIEKAILYLREEMLSGESNYNLAATIKSLQQLHTLLKTTNVNPRFAIENTLLSL